MTNNQLQINFNPNILDYILISESNDWIYELKEKKEKAEKLFNLVKKIYEKRK